MFHLLDFVLRRRMMVAIGALVLILLGGMAWSRLSVDAFPDVTNQQVMIITDLLDSDSGSRQS